MVGHHGSVPAGEHHQQSAIARRHGGAKHRFRRFVEPLQILGDKQSRDLESVPYGEVRTLVSTFGTFTRGTIQCRHGLLLSPR